MTPKEIREMAAAFQKSRVLLTAFELDIFSCIGEKSLDAPAIAAALGLNENATERLLNALVALQLLEKQQGLYSNTADGRMFFSKDSAAYLGGLMHTNDLWKTWSNLTEVVRTGVPAHRAEINDRGGEWLEAFIRAMHDRGKKQAPADVAGIALEGVGSLLDVGGGSGCFCMAFLDRKPSIKAVIFDLPNVVPIARKIIAQEGYTDKITHCAGDYTTDMLPTGFDLAFLSAVIHSNPATVNRDLVRKCYDSLNANGQIVIQDWIMNDDRTAPVQGALFSINMLVGVNGGDCYTEGEIRSWLEEAGFSDIRSVALSSGNGQVIAVKR